MLKVLERKLKRKARKMGLGKKKAEAYVYGALCKTGWKQKARGKKEPGR